MAKRKIRKFAEGGYETTEGQNPNIDDETRSRALKYVEGASEESRNIGEPVTRSASKSTSKISQTVAPTKPKAEAPEEYKERMETLTKKQGLERVEPENYIPGPGLLKGMLKSAVRAGEKDIARSITTRAGKEIPIKQGKMDVKPPMKAGEYRNKSSKKVTVKRGEDGIVDDGGSGAFKRGGSVSSASKRADGIATKGKTRGKMC